MTSLTLSANFASAVMILAAGQGKRMRSNAPKVLHEVGGEPLLFHILDKVREGAPNSTICVVVGHGREKVEAAVKAAPRFAGTDIHFVFQAEQRGTGHAARCAMDSPWGEAVVKQKLPVLVLPGDLPLMTSALVREMVEPLGRIAAMRLLTTELPDPSGYGRIVRRGKSGPVLRIVEERDCNQRERNLHEVGASIYAFQAAFMKSGLSRLSNKNSQGEYYLTDLISQASRLRKRIDVLKWAEHEDLRGVNDRWELALAGRILNERIVKHWAQAGVRFVDPWTTYLEVGVELAEDVTVYPGTLLQGRTKIATGAVIGPNCKLRNMTVGEGAQVKAGTVGDDSVICAGASVGPYAHLRPDSTVGARAKIGNFVELKKTTIGEGTAVSHLSYLGDATVGKNANIGCGFVTCNFDGRVIDGQRKHRTIIEDDVFMGSDCQTVAPVKIGRGAFVASGSTITDDVEPEALAIARARQVTKSGYARKLKG